MRGLLRIEAYAIVSADGMIADETGKYPTSLKFDADQRYLREWLDRAAVIVQGRNSGTGQPNWRKRLRLIMTRKVAGLAPHPDIPNARFWNPAGASLEEACTQGRPGQDRESRLQKDRCGPQNRRRRLHA